MLTAATIATAIVGIIHTAIAIAEIFLWLSFKLYERFNFDETTAQLVYPIVKNVGLYNGFIAAGLLWAAFATQNSVALRVFFLSCVIVAGIFGAITLGSWNAFLLQTVPGFIALILVRLAKV